jgi:DNA-binding beta-propeller fold protein YncE
MGKFLLKSLGVVATLAAVILFVGWLAFVPSASEPGYRFVAAWGTKGDTPGMFNDPTGIAISGDDIFIADSRNGRIQVFDLEGRFRRAFGTRGAGVGELDRPMNLTIQGNELYVPEYFNDRIQVFGLDGTPIRIIGEAGDGPGQFNAPGGIAVGADGTLYVADFYNQRVQQLAPDGTFIDQIGETGTSGFWAGEFNYPTDVAIAPGGTLFVADGYNDRVQVFDADGDFLRKWGGPFAINIFGPFNGWFATVTNIALDDQGNVFVADFYNHRIQKFTADGTFLTSFGTEGSGPGEFFYPIALDVMPDGSLYVVDFGNNRIQKWEPR